MARRLCPEVPWWASAIAAWALLSVRPGPSGAFDALFPSLGDAGVAEPRRLGHGASNGSDTSAHRSAGPRAEVDAMVSDRWVPGVAGGTGAVARAYVLVPCWIQYTPCGNISLPHGGLTLTSKTRVGNFPGDIHLPGPGHVKPALEHFQEAFSEYTAAFCGFGIALWFWSKVASADQRQRLANEFQDWRQGVVKYHESKCDDGQDPDDPEVLKDRAAEIADRMDPKSDNFIAPGNIYRVLAVLHPSRIGWHQWLSIAGKALVCAYMQAYMPAKIIWEVFAEWTCIGIKSPLWFINDGVAFMTMFASLGALCNIFQGRCSKEIKVGAEANYYILTHYEPEAPVGSERAQYTLLDTLRAVAARPEDAEAPRARSLLRDMGASPTAPPQQNALSPFHEGVTFTPPDTRRAQPSGGLESSDPHHAHSGPDSAFHAAPSGYSHVSQGHDRRSSAFPTPAVPAQFIRTSELLWCWLSISLNIAMCLLLQVAMILKLSTFIGHIDDVAIEAVALYFIFDLDTKILESDGYLRLLYRRNVVKRTLEILEEEKGPAKRLFGFADLALKATSTIAPLGLWSIILLAWRNNASGLVIGGSGMHVRGVEH